MLEAAQWEVIVRPPSVDDGALDAAGEHPRAWTMAMAWLKAKSVLDDIQTQPGDLLLAADTVCALDNVVMGQPPSRTSARTMLHALRGCTHAVWTGMCLLPVGGDRCLGAAVSNVTIGALSDTDIETYLDTEHWRGKAGGYNLSDRIEAGWPLHCDGEPETVMGLSMDLLEQLFLEVSA
jgi:septum formation protein